MTVLLSMHSIFRWVVVLVGVGTLVKFAFGWLSKAEFKPFDGTLSKVYPIVMDIQVTLGVVLFVWDGLEGAGFPGYRIEHGIILLLVAGVAHLMSRWEAALDALRFRNGFFVVLATLLLIFAGVMALPGGMARWAIAG